MAELRKTGTKGILFNSLLATTSLNGVIITIKVVISLEVQSYLKAA